MQAISLRCEHREDTPCVDHPAPRLSWALTGGERQTAYRIRVAEAWDSGRVASARSVDVPYGGPPLAPGREWAWRVQVWDEAGEPGPWSEPARFRTGLAEWTAQWISRDPVHDPAMPVPGTDDELDESDLMMRRLPGCPYLRRRFSLDGELARATLYATARGVYELELNGERVGDAVLAPGWTDYRRRIEYAVHDVTALLRRGENVIAATLGDGWYAGFVGFDARRPGNHYGRDPELLCELHVELADGSRTVVAGDERWEAAYGPLVYSDPLMGERYDARREPGPWHPVRVRARDHVALVPERARPIRVTEDLEPVSVTRRAAGVHVVDLGQNMVGRVRLEVRGERGTRVQLRHAVMLERDGSLYV
jgi:alpha-L-rhamnosidase